jgi:hypothetical protein
VTRPTYQIRFVTDPSQGQVNYYLAKDPDTGQPRTFTRKADAIRWVVLEVAMWRRGEGPMNSWYRLLRRSARYSGFTAWKAKADRSVYQLLVAGQPFARVEVIEGGQV